MNLEEVLKKESVGEAELKVLSANMHRLSKEDKIRYGFETTEEVESEVEESPVVPAPKASRKKKN